jgi:hypothetical protein
MTRNPNEIFHIGFLKKEAIVEVKKPSRAFNVDFVHGCLVGALFASSAWILGFAIFFALKALEIL